MSPWRRRRVVAAGICLVVVSAGAAFLLHQRGNAQEQVRATDTDRFYTRYGNPTHTVAETAIAELEGADAALLFSSGMAAITTSFLSLVKSGDHIVAQRDIYGGVTKFLSQWLPKPKVTTCPRVP